MLCEGVAPAFLSRPGQRLTVFMCLNVAAAAAAAAAVVAVAVAVNAVQVLLLSARSRICTLQEGNVVEMHSQMPPGGWPAAL